MLGDVFVGSHLYNVSAVFEVGTFPWCLWAFSRFLEGVYALLFIRER